MPEQTAPLALDRRYSDREFARLSAGQIPQEMEDKWFVYYSEPCLYLHRSWTGICVYKVEFKPDERWFVVRNVIVNRDSSQYTETNDVHDSMLLGILLDSRAGRDTKEQWDEYLAAKR